MANCHRATTASDDCCWSRDRKIRRRRFAHEGPYKLLPLSLLNALSLMTVSSFHPSQLRCEVYFRRLIHTNCEGVSNGKQCKVDFIVDLKLQLRYSKISTSRACLTTDVASLSLSCPSDIASKKPFLLLLLLFGKCIKSSDLERPDMRVSMLTETRSHLNARDVSTSQQRQA